MKAFCFSLWLVVFLTWSTGIPDASAAVRWRLSVKILLDGDNHWPTSTEKFNLCSPQGIQARIDDYNRMLDSMGWGFRLSLVEMLAVRDSTFYNANPSVTRDWEDFEREVDLNRNGYGYRGDAINIYIGHSTGSGVTSGRPSAPLLGDVILLGKDPSRETMLHEIGHSLGLCHTHGCGINECHENCPGDDDTWDTLPDSSQWNDRDEVARYSFSNRTYAQLQPWQQTQVDDVWWNLMSYHNGGGRDRLTRGQWEFLVDVCNDPLRRRMVCSGSTVFVDAAAAGLSPCELASQLAGLVESLPGPVSWYADELDAHPPGPEYLLRRNCGHFDIDPPGLPRPDNWPPPAWPDAWPPLSDAPRPSDEFYPDSWPWPPDPDPFTVCIGGAYRTIQEALHCAAQDGDRLQIRAGSYNERLIISKRLTLATDRGSVFIGKP